MAADPKKAERLRRTWARAKSYGVKVLDDLQRGVDPESKGTWKDRSNRIAAAAILAQAHASEERAAKQAAAPTQLAIMVVHGRMRDHSKWEQLAAAEEGKAIDAVYESELLGPAGADGAGAQELRGDRLAGQGEEEAQAQHQTQEGKGR
jgi:hypothetical protein